MADMVDYKIYGDDMQLVEIELDPGEGIRAEVGAMMYMEEGIVMQTNTGGGLFRGLKRMMTGESFFITNFVQSGEGKGHVAFGAPYPGKIVPIDLIEFNGTFICQKDSFLCAANGIEIEVEFTKRIGTGLFGGEGFILQRLEGHGLAFIHAGGALIERQLQPGEILKVDTGCVVGFSKTVNYDIQFIGGFTNALFGGEGLFIATLKGPGTIYLQSLPFSRLADRINAAAKYQNKGENRNVSRGFIGGLFNDDRRF
ncbi:hypothetical protein CN13_02900 [Petrotoga sp. HKA.pet.4.5]|uniref:TIGR00266 family protein n=1 Tax=unclassified Petrotoga TaxID=2620614 RepID=UPI000EF1638B|nr:MULTISPECIES: TIGR00266 family protein [unclassified Petrotoga]RLL82354.1 hypothetical protein BZ25_09475 [Petrotoga sp. Shatin.DS.tank11.9.2.9.3]RLL90071.1 hypothetical protein CN13_02900 [Petrotoga sp. HKA.pet.4.5]